MNDVAVYRTAPATLGLLITLHGVGPVNNRPSVDKLHHFVQRKEKEKCGMQHTDIDNPGCFLLFWGCLRLFKTNS